MSVKPPAAGQRLRVLLVEDDPVDRLAVERAFRANDLPYEIIAAESCAEGLEQIGKGGIDVVLLDHKLPDGTGFDVLAHLNGLPAIFVTGGGDEGVAVQAMRDGAYDYLMKDTAGRYLKILPSVIQNVMERRRAEKGMEEAKLELERRVEARTVELRRANERLEHAIRERRLAEEEARRHQEELAHAARVHLAGELAAGIAHELNQPLAAIANYARGSLRRLEAGQLPEEELRGVLERSDAEARRAAQIVGHLRDLVQKRESTRRPVNLNALVRGLREFIAAEPGMAETELVLDLQDPLPGALADPIQLEQVILNLVRNGLEAMSATPVGSRRLVIRTRSEPPAQVGLSVEDAGHGADADTLRRVFDPFFTTKESGMGIGLSVCRTIIEAHEGRLGATSNQGPGTTFSFTLPAIPSTGQNGE